ncbi:MAG: glycosyltransferase family 4 protein [Candidatus Hodarchaeota archaeon]
MNICIISQCFWPDISGTTIRMSNLIKALKMLSQHNIVVLTAFPHYPHGKIPRKYHGKLFYRERWNDIDIIRVFMLGIPHKSFPTRLINYVMFTFSSLIGLNILKDVDCFISLSPNFFSFFIGLGAKFRYKKPVLLDVTDLWPEALTDLGYIKKSSILARFMRLTRTWCLNLADGILTISETIRNYLIQSGVSSEKIFTILVGADTHTLRPTIPIEERSSNKPLSIGYVGCLAPAYDFKILMTAAKRLETENIRFTIHGQGEKLPQIEKLLRLLKLQNVKLSNQYLPFDQYKKLMSGFDIFILPMEPVNLSSTALPAKLFDYMSFGRPIVVVSKGEPAELVKRAQAGLVIPYNGSKALAKSIRLLKEDNEKREIYGKNARMYASRNLSLKSISKRLEKVLNLITESN